MLQGVKIILQFPNGENRMKKTLQLKDHEEIVTSESEDGNYMPDTLLIR